MTRQTLTRVALALALVAVVVLAYLNREKIHLASLQAQIESLGVWAPAAFIALYTLGSVLFAPGSVMTPLGGALFGPWLGALYCLIGATLGAAVAFLVARYLAHDWAIKKSEGKLAALMNGIREEGWRFVAFARLLPLIPFNLLNYALGLTPIGFRAYLVTSFVCMAPGAIAYAYLGHAIKEATTGTASTTETINTAFIALGLLVLVVFLPRFVKRLRAKP